MSFGSKKTSVRESNPALPYTPRSANSSVILSGIAGMRPNRNPAISSIFARGADLLGGLGSFGGRAKRVALGGGI